MIVCSYVSPSCILLILSQSGLSKPTPIKPLLYVNTIFPLVSYHVSSSFCCNTGKLVTGAHQDKFGPTMLWQQEKLRYRFVDYHWRYAYPFGNIEDVFPLRTMIFPDTNSFGVRLFFVFYRVLLLKPINCCFNLK